nr:hypothetical protein [Tanacetum cinerariifolium]
SSMGELTFFLGLQVKQKEDGIFISHDKYVAEILRKFGLTNGKSANTPIDTEKPLLKDPDVKRIFMYLKSKPHLGLWYPKDSPFHLVAYSDSNYAGASLDRKSTTRGCQFLGHRLISWQCKKQTVVATSSTKAEYVTNDVVRLQALIDRRKVLITEDTVTQALRLDDVDSIDCLPNEEIFTELARMGLVRNVDSPSKYMYPRLLQLILNAQIANISSYNTKYISHALTQKQVQDDIDVAAKDEDVIEPTLPTPATTPPPPPQELIPSSSQVAPTPPPSPH